eukprot:COSAG01_NODE_7531_length_3164_cov_17.239804_2_plen_81_part_00
MYRATPAQHEALDGNRRDVEGALREYTDTALYYQIEKACAAEANSRLTQISIRDPQLFPPGRGQQRRDCLSIKGGRHKPY